MTLQKLRINTDEKGFTLIELMIVIAIIGILAAIAIPNFISYRDKAYCSAAESDANSILAGIADHFAIPNHITITDTTITNAGGEVDITGANGDADASFAKLSGSNTATVYGPVNNIVVSVLDASGRCPEKYRDAGTAGTVGTTEGWTHGTGGTYHYTKAMD